MTQVRQGGYQAFHLAHQQSSFPWWAVVVGVVAVAVGTVIVAFFARRRRRLSD